MPGEGHSPAERMRVMEMLSRWSETIERERLILASNRGPLEYACDCEGEGQPEARQGSGGVVSGLLCAVRRRPVTWIALAMTDADRAMARQASEPDTSSIVDERLPDIEVRLVDIPHDAYRRHYLGISNRILWFAQHYLLAPTQTKVFSKRAEDDWREGYEVANRAVAEAVIGALRDHGEQTPVLFQDYHLYLAPYLVRSSFPHARLAHFVHIPWPDARYWEMLPDYMVRNIYQGLTANDVVGFQTMRDAHNFLLGAERYLRDARLEWTPRSQGGVLIWPHRHTEVRAFPIAVTHAEVERCANGPAARREAAEVQRQITRGDQDHRLIVRVDRLEPTKNIVRGFQAFERLLTRYPSWQGKVTFLAQLVPSRQELTAYRQYERQVRRIVERINARFGRPDWQPVVCILENNRPGALALMRHYHVLLVNPLIDGMNLVVKEGGLLNQNDGMIVLSRTAGAFEQLGEHVLGIHPMDVDQTAEALRTALEMPGAERKRQAFAVRTLLRQESAEAWMDAQLARLVRRETLSTWPMARPDAQAHDAAAQPLAQPAHRAMAAQLPTRLPPEWANELPDVISSGGEDTVTLPL
jgi:trehalose 6-phosphate synthase